MFINWRDFLIEIVKILSKRMLTLLNVKHGNVIVIGLNVLEAQILTKKH